jgi:hypothetical protein
LISTLVAYCTTVCRVVSENLQRTIRVLKIFMLLRTVLTVFVLCILLIMMSIELHTVLYC